MAMAVLEAVVLLLAEMVLLAQNASMSMCTIFLPVIPTYFIP
jgi:hypothetical protein